MLNELKRGDVRVQSLGSARQTTVEVWTGEEWLPVRFVTGISWTLDASTAAPVLAVKLMLAEVALLTPAERIALDLVRGGFLGADAAEVG